MRLAKNKKSLRYGSLVVAAGLTATTMFALTQASQAATLQQVFMRFDRMQAGTATTGTVCAKPSATDTEASVKVSFPTGFVVSTTTSNWTVDTTTATDSWPGSGTAVAWPGIATATDATGQDVTFPSSDLTAGTLYCFNWTDSAALSQPGSAAPNETGSVTTLDGTSAEIDSAQYATATLASDRITVTATVPPAFNFAIGSNTDALGNLSTASVTSTHPLPNTLTVNTNAKNGWTVWAKDSNQGLTSSSAAYTIPDNCSSGAGSNSVLSAGSEGYNTGVTLGTQDDGTGIGNTTVNAIFDGTTTNAGGGLCSNLQALATSTGTAANANLAVTNNASIKGSTPAANDYTDVITFVAAGLF